MSEHCHLELPEDDAPDFAREAWLWFEREHPDCAVRRIELCTGPRRWSARLEQTCGRIVGDAVRVTAQGLVL